jgi:hypothetical protein
MFAESTLLPGCVAKIGSVLTGKGEQTMPDKEKAVKGMECCLSTRPCEECPYQDGAPCDKGLKHDVYLLLKNEEERYAGMVLSWLTEIALNNSDAREEMPYIDAITDIRNRAKTGLKQYFIDKQKGQE